MKIILRTAKRKYGAAVALAHTLIKKFKGKTRVLEHDGLTATLSRDKVVVSEGMWRVVDELDLRAGRGGSEYTHLVDSYEFAGGTVLSVFVSDSFSPPTSSFNHVSELPGTVFILRKDEAGAVRVVRDENGSPVYEYFDPPNFYLPGDTNDLDRYPVYKIMGVNAEGTVVSLLGEIEGVGDAYVWVLVTYERIGGQWQQTFFKRGADYWFSGLQGTAASHGPLFLGRGQIPPPYSGDPPFAAVISSDARWRPVMPDYSALSPTNVLASASGRALKVIVGVYSDGVDGTDEITQGFYALPDHTVTLHNEVVEDTITDSVLAGAEGWRRTPVDGPGLCLMWRTVSLAWNVHIPYLDVWVVSPQGEVTLYATVAAEDLIGGAAAASRNGRTAIAALQMRDPWRTELHVYHAASSGALSAVIPLDNLSGGRMVSDDGSTAAAVVSSVSGQALVIFDCTDAGITQHTFPLSTSSNSVRFVNSTSVQVSSGDTFSKLRGEWEHVLRRSEMYTLAAYVPLSEALDARAVEYIALDATPRVRILTPDNTWATITPPWPVPVGTLLLHNAAKDRLLRVTNTVAEWYALQKNDSGAWELVRIEQMSPEDTTYSPYQYIGGRSASAKDTPASWSSPYAYLTGRYKFIWAQNLGVRSWEPAPRSGGEFPNTPMLPIAAHSAENAYASPKSFIVRAGGGSMAYIYEYTI